MRTAIKAFGSALKLGHTYLYQSLPRLLSIWFEFGTAFSQSSMSHYSSEYDTVQMQDGKVCGSQSERQLIFLSEKEAFVGKIGEDLQYRERLEGPPSRVPVDHLFPSGNCFLSCYSAY